MKFVDKELISGVTEKDMKGNGLIIKCMGRAI